MLHLRNEIQRAVLHNEEMTGGDQETRRLRIIQINETRQQFNSNRMKKIKEQKRQEVKEMKQMLDFSIKQAKFLNLQDIARKRESLEEHSFSLDDSTSTIIDVPSILRDSVKSAKRLVVSLSSNYYNYTYINLF